MDTLPGYNLKQHGPDYMQALDALSRPKVAETAN
jgi:hypothetical protein